MSVLSLLAGRYLLGLRRRTHVAAVSAVSFSAMALGAAALVITLALLEGFQSTIRRQLEESGVHAVLRPRSGQTLPPGDWLDRLRERHPDLKVRATVGGAVWCIAEGGAIPAEMTVEDGLSRVEVNRILAARLAVGAGSRLTLASPHLVLTPLGPLPLRRTVEVGAVGEVRPGEEQAEVRVPAAVGFALLGASGPRTVELQATDPAKAWQVASLVQGDVPDGIEIVGFRELNRPLLAALALERAMIGFGVALVMAVAALNLLCNLALVAAEKRADVALLAAMGLEPGAVRRLFLALGLGVGALGGVLGTLLGGAVATILERTRALPLPRGVFVVSHVPFRVTVTSIVVVLSVSLASALLASLAPARAAARRDILQGLRYE
ncbi:MAG: FtsX-like permease family protein [Acidobacteriota bacterium]